MTRVVVWLLLALAAVSMGLRTTSLLIPRVHPWFRMVVSVVIGTALAVFSLRLSDSYQVRDLGLGLLISLSPVGVFDMAKWWYRWR